MACLPQTHVRTAIRERLELRADHRQQLQAGITTDPMLQMDDAISFFEFGKINIQRRSCRLRVRRLKTPRPLDSITPKDLRIGHNHQLRRLAQKPPRHHPDLYLRKACLLSTPQSSNFLAACDEISNASSPRSFASLRFNWAFYTWLRLLCYAFHLVSAVNHGCPC